MEYLEQFPQANWCFEVTAINTPMPPAELMMKPLTAAVFSIGDYSCLEAVKMYGVKHEFVYMQVSRVHDKKTELGFL